MPTSSNSGSLSRETEDILLDFKPGQKKETPPPASGTRVFYESLYKQNSKSFMALKWCVEYGILPKKDCKKAVEGMFTLERVLIYLIV